MNVTPFEGARPLHLSLLPFHSRGSRAHLFFYGIGRRKAASLFPPPSLEKPDLGVSRPLSLVSLHAYPLLSFFSLCPSFFFLSDGHRRSRTNFSIQR